MARGDGLRPGVSPFVVIEVDSELRVVDWCGQAEREFGVARAEAVGRAVATVVPVDDGEAAWRGLVDGDGGPRAWRLARAGDGRTFEWRRQPLVDADGAVRGALCFGFDVTARVAAERRHRLEEQMLAAICTNLQIVLWAVDRAGVVLYHEGLTATAYPLLGKNLFEVFAHNPSGLAQLRRALAGEPQIDGTFEGGQYWQSWMIPVDDRITGVAVYAISLEVSELKRGEIDLRDKLAIIERQQQAIRAMSTPIIEVWDGVLTLPILGLVDSVRTAEIMECLLQSVTRVRARFAILDMTGVDVVDTSTAGHLLGLIRAIRLLGAEGIITGIHPNIAQTMVGLDVDLSGINVHANLREALKHCIARARPR